MLLLLLLAPLLASVQEPGRAEVWATYLGNAGFLLEFEAGEDTGKVLVDALVSRRMTAYVDQSEGLRGDLLAARPPFDDVDLVLATHAHGDHFDAVAVGTYLTANTGARFVSTEQAVAALERGFDGFAAIEDRVRAVKPEAGGRVVLAELGVTVLDLHHGRDRSPPVQNHGFLIERKGARILHLGDTEVTADELAPMKLDALAIDAALVPSWYFDAAPWKGAIEGAVAPRLSVVMHLPPDWEVSERTVNQRQARARVPRIREAYPRALVPRRELERLRLVGP